VNTSDDYMDYIETLTAYFDELDMMYYGDWSFNIPCFPALKGMPA
jgi:hypothetical protein